MKRIVLAGGGHAHLAVLKDWAARHSLETERVLVTASRYTYYSGMLPGWIAGVYQTEDLRIDLAPLAQLAGAQLLIDEIVGLDADRQILNLASGKVMPFALLSLATGGEADLSSLAALSQDRLLAVRPVDRFMEDWSKWLSGIDAGWPAHLAVVGGGAAGVELALAARAALSGDAASIALVTPEADFLNGHSAPVRRRVMAELQRRGVAVHFAHAAGADDGLLLSNNTFLPADYVIAATGSRAPRWLARSGLECTPAGFACVSADMRSVSHRTIFAAGDIIQRMDRPLPRSGVHAVKAGPVLSANLRASLAGGRLSSYQPGERTLYLLATGQRRAIGSFGGLSFSGRAVWWLKNWIDQRFVRGYRAAEPQGDLQ